MGYQVFDSNEEEVLEAFLHSDKNYGTPIVPKTDEMITAYDATIKSLLRKCFIIKCEGGFKITDRGTQAITEFHQKGQFWVISLKLYRSLQKS